MKPIPEGLPERWHGCWPAAVEETAKIGIAGVKSWSHEALERIAALESFLEKLRWLDNQGCCTGDCPHDSSAGCAADLIEMLREVAVAARNYGA